MPTSTGPAGTDEVRRRNTALVLRLLRDEGTLSRAELSRRSGLVKATVGAIVGHLEDVGAVSAGSSSPSGRGRPSVPLTLAGGTHAGLGVEVNVDYLAATAVDLAGNELSFVEVPHDAGAAQLDELLRLVGAETDRLARLGVPLLGLTVAVPGLIDRRRGVVVDAPNLGWTDLPLADRVRSVLPAGVSVAVDNDANCAARAEGIRGVAVGVDDFVYLTGTVGLGAGIVSSGRVLRGAHGLAGEVGHLRVGDGRHRCACGRTGCWEALVGQRAMAEATGVAVAPGEDPVAYAERLAADATAPRSVRRIGTSLGRGVAQLAATLDPAMVVLGGAFVPLGAVLVPAVRSALAESFTGSDCEVALSTMGLHAASVGAAVDALDDVFEGRRLPVA